MMRRMSILMVTMLAVPLLPGTTRAQGDDAAASGYVSLKETQEVPERFRRPVTLALHNVTLEDALRRAAEGAGVALAYSRDVLPSAPTVALEMEGAPVADVFRRLLAGTGLDLLVASNGRATLVWRDPETVGVLRGRVVDASTGAPISGADIVVVGTARRTRTADDGTFRLTGIEEGEVRLRASSLGYRSVEVIAEVPATGAAEMEIALEPEAILLDEVVVTGSMIPTEVRSVPTSVAVVTRDDIERIAPGSLDDILRTTTAGVTAYDLGAVDYFSVISVRGAADLNSGNSVKVYVDGVEVANPSYVTNMDPGIIERIEIIRGPQASTMYGSDAIGGVIQIFTKKGSPAVTEPRLEAEAGFGLVQSDVGEGTVEHDHSVSLTGGGERFAFNVSGAVVQSGEWVDEAHNEQLELFGSGRGRLGDLTLSFTGRFHGRGFGFVRNPVLKESYPALSSDLALDGTVRQQTVSVAGEYPVSDRWTHRATLGYDRNLLEIVSTRPLERFPGDTLLGMVRSASQGKASFDYQTSFRLGDPDRFGLDLTSGFNMWEAEVHALGANNVPTSRGRLDGALSAPTRDRYLNRGAWLQARASVADRFFLTGGMRGEDNDNFGQDYGIAWAPRIGGSYVVALDAAEFKVRGSWGRAIRPPSSTDKIGYSSSQEAVLPAPDLGPEIQEGWDAGVDLQVGRTASFSLTYFDQTAQGLIDPVLLEAREDGFLVYQNQNVGRVANRGWELEGRWRHGSLSVEADYGRVTTEVEALSPDYAGDLRVGDAPLAVPEWSAGARVSYRYASTTASLGVSGVGEAVNYDWVALYDAFFGDATFTGSYRDYRITYPAFSKIDLNIAHDFTDRYGVFLRIRNLTNRQEPERVNTDVVRGRVTTLGIRVVR